MNNNVGGGLFLEFGVKGLQSIDGASKRINGLKTQIRNTALAFTGAGFAIEKLFNTTLDREVLLKNINRQTGLNIQQLQEWAKAGELVDLSLNPTETIQNIAKLEKALAKVRLGENVGLTEALGRLDIFNIEAKNAFEILEDVSRVFRENNNIDQATKSILVEQLGLNASFLNLLEESQEVRKELGKGTFLTKEQAKNVDTLGSSIVALKQTMIELKDQGIANLTPSANELVNDFLEYIIENKQSIIAGFEGMARGVGNFATSIAKGLNTIGDFVAKLTLAENSFEGLQNAVWLIGSVFFPVRTGLLAIISSLDDLKSMSGTKLIVSAIGGIAMLKFLKTTLGSLKSIQSVVGGIGNVAKSGAVAGVTGKVAGKIGKVAKLTPALAPLLFNPATLTALGIGATGVGLGFATKKLFFDDKDTVNNGISPLSSPAITPAMSPLMSRPNTNNVKNEVSNVININGGDTQEVRRVVEDIISTQVQNAIDNTQPVTDV